jgi:endo-1,4-beta-xylanase
MILIVGLLVLVASAGLRLPVAIDAAAFVGLGAGDTACDLHAPDTCTLRDLASRSGRRIGATAEPSQILSGPYADTLAREFSSLTPENALKWYTVQPTRGGWNFGPADAVVDFAVAHGMEVRGHTLVWAQDTFTPGWVKAITDPGELRAVVAEHINAVVDRYHDRVHRWDVVNEPLESIGPNLSDNVFRRVLGAGYLAEIFALAHAADPSAELWLNEFGTDWVPGKHEALVELVRQLVADGVPIHGVGIQMHRFTTEGPDLDTFRRQLDAIAATGVKVAITELDVATVPGDPEAFTRQAGAYERIATACLMVDACEEITTWGVTDAATWLDRLGTLPTPTRPLLFDDQYARKPAYFALRGALLTALTGFPPLTQPPPPPLAASPVAVAPAFTG